MSGRTLLARLDNAGDVLLAGPAVRAVAAGGTDLTLLVSPRGLEAAAMLPGVGEILVHDAEWISLEPAPVRRRHIEQLVSRLAEVEVDEAVILTSFHQSPLPLALLLKMAGVPCVAAVSDDYPGSLLDLRHEDPGDVHEVERSLSLVARLSYRLPAGDDGSLRVQLGDADPIERLGADVVAALPAPGYVVVHPGASAPARAWSARRHAELCAALAAAGLDVVVTGSSVERPLTAAVAGTHALDLGGRTDLAGLATVLAGAGALVCGNTGPAHLAAAVGCPVVSLYAPTVPPARWRPWRVPHRLLGTQSVPCAGCRARSCPVPGHPCLEDVTVGEVLEAACALRRSPAESVAVA